MSSIISQPDFRQIIDIEPEEIWNYTEPKKGDHIRVYRGHYNHHGVYISNEEVIHFTGTDADNILDWSKNEVIKTDLENFLRGGTLEVKEYTEEELNDVYPVEHIIMYARACLGDKGYNLVFNNCEHFANVCTLGRFRSRQVERVFDSILSGITIPIQEGKMKMGLFGSIGGFLKGLFGGSSSGGSRSTTTTTYNYEPDKVKVAEIEADTKLRLAGMENERIELMKNARLELLEFETQSKIALEEAKARGLNIMAQTIVNMQERLNEVAEKRLQIIQKGSLQIINEIESFYDELGQKIKADNHNYTHEKFPQLMEILEKYEEGTSSHELYKKRIQDDMELQTKHCAMQLNAVMQRQSQVINGFNKTRDKIIEQTGQITAGVLEKIADKQLALERESKSQAIMIEEENDKLMIESSEKEKSC